MRKTLVPMLLFAGACGRTPFAGPADAGASGWVEPLCDGARCGQRLARSLGSACLIRDGGELWCWGANARGQLGTAASNDKVRPTKVAGLPPVTQVVTGSYHACALSTVGEVWCWGDDRFGQLGDGHFEGAAHESFRETPAALKLPAAARQLRVTEVTTCADLVDGQTWCWGRYDQAHLPWVYDTEAVSNGEVLTIAPPGYQTSCVLAPSGDVACARPSESLDAWLATKRVNLSAPAVAVASAMPAETACALHATGRVSCWGLWNSVTTPEPPFAVEGVEVTGLWAGWLNFCGLTKNRRLVCFSAMTAPVVQTLAARDVVDFALGGWGLCARQATGEVLCTNSLGDQHDGSAEPLELVNGFPP